MTLHFLWLEKAGNFGGERWLLMSDIQTKIFNVISATVVFIIFCFASAWILFEFKGSSTSLKDTWSIVSSLFGGAATLVAAYIASLLFNDWRELQTGINRSDLAKNTQLSLHRLISYLDYYHNLVINKKGVLNATSIPNISKIFIDQAENIPKECEALRSSFHAEYEELYKQFHIDLMIYENTFQSGLEVDLDRVLYYRGTIGGMLRDLSQSKPNNELNQMVSQMINSKNYFEENVVEPITHEMSKYINIKVNHKINN